MLKSAHPPANQGGGALQQRQKIGGGLLIAHQQLAEAVEPRVGALHHPAAGALALPTGARLLPALPHMRRITSRLAWLARPDARHSPCPHTGFAAAAGWLWDAPPQCC